jgi:hypothetical protein
MSRSTRNCIFPLVVRLRGVPNDERLAETSEAIARVIAGRLLEANRVIAAREGWHSWHRNYAAPVLRFSGAALDDDVQRQVTAAIEAGIARAITGRPGAIAAGMAQPQFILARYPSRTSVPAAPVRRTAPPPAKQHISWETALTVMNAIAEIINVQVEVDETKGLVRETQYPSVHKEVPDQYRLLLNEWFYITHGYSSQNRPGKPSVTIRGAMLRTHIDGAVADTMPFINELIKEGDPDSTGSWLDTNIFQKITEFRDRALKEDVSDTIAAARPLPNKESPDLERETEEEKLQAVIREELETIEMASLLALRFLHKQVEHAAEQAEKTAQLEELFEKIRDEAIKAGEKESSAVLKPITRMDMPTSLLFFKGGLLAAVSILSVTDPEERKRLFAKQKGFFGEAKRDADVVKLLASFVGGAIAVTKGATYALARVTGNAKLAAEVLATGIPGIEKAVAVLNVVGVIHGVLMLIDPDSTGEQRAEGALELTVGGLGIAPKVAKLVGASGAAEGIAAIAGPLSTSLVISFYTIRWLGETAAGAAVGWIKGGLNGVFEDMRENALYVQSTALKLAAAAQLALYDKDPQRARELLKQADGLRWNLVEYFIRPYLQRATVGRRNVFGMPYIKDPASWSEELIKRFQPLVGRKGDTNEQALALAADFIHVVAKCFANQEEILRVTIDEAMNHRDQIGI